MVFEKKIDTSNRNAMIDFLSNHFRYDTMNSWNRATSYANNVKIHELQYLGALTKEEADIGYDFITTENWSYENDIAEIKRRFTEKTGYAIGFNGRSGGYLVLYDTQPNKTGKPMVMIGHAIDQYADFTDEDEWDMASLKERTELVTTFDHACDEILEVFKSYLHESTCLNITVTKQESVSISTYTADLPDNMEELSKYHIIVRRNPCYSNADNEKPVYLSDVAELPHVHSEGGSLEECTVNTLFDISEYLQEHSEE